MVKILKSCLWHNTSKDQRVLQKESVVWQSDSLSCAFSSMKPCSTVHVSIFTRTDAHSTVLGCFFTKTNSSNTVKHSFKTRRESDSSNKAREGVHAFVCVDACLGGTRTCVCAAPLRLTDFSWEVWGSQTWSHKIRSRIRSKAETSLLQRRLGLGLVFGCDKAVQSTIRWFMVWACAIRHSK